MQAEGREDREAVEATMDTVDDHSHCTLPPSGMVYCASGMEDA